MRKENENASSKEQRDDPDKYEKMEEEDLHAIRNAEPPITSELLSIQINSTSDRDEIQEDI